MFFEKNRYFDAILYVHKLLEKDRYYQYQLELKTNTIDEVSLVNNVLFGISLYNFMNKNYLVHNFSRTTIVRNIIILQLKILLLIGGSSYLKFANEVSTYMALNCGYNYCYDDDNNALFNHDFINIPEVYESLGVENRLGDNVKLIFCDDFPGIWLKLGLLREVVGGIDLLFYNYLYYYFSSTLNLFFIITRSKLGFEEDLLIKQKYTVLDVFMNYLNINFFIDKFEKKIGFNYYERYVSSNRYLGVFSRYFGNQMLKITINNYLVGKRLNSFYVENIIIGYDSQFYYGILDNNRDTKVTRYNLKNLHADIRHYSLFFIVYRSWIKTYLSALVKLAGGMSGQVNGDQLLLAMRKVSSELKHNVESVRNKKLRKLERLKLERERSERRAERHFKLLERRRLVDEKAIESELKKQLRLEKKIILMKVNEEKRAEKLRLKEDKNVEKLRLKEERRLEKLRLKEEKRSEKLRLKEEKRSEKLRLKEEKRAERVAKKLLKGCKNS